MLGRLFGRTKDDHDDTVCSTCGRTLLAGEWTQRVVDNDGAERFICALCARSGDFSAAIADPVDDIATVTTGRVRPARTDSDAFWRALKDKDTEIARLESLLARAEAENQELAAQLAESRGSVAPVVPLVSVATESPAAPVSHDDIGGATAEYTAADLKAVDALDAAEPPADESDEAAPLAAGAPAAAATRHLEHTDPGLGKALRDAARTAAGADALAARDEVGADTAALPTAQAPFDDGPRDVLAPVPGGAPPFDDQRTAPSDDRAAAPTVPGFEPEPEPEDFVPLTILQRGVDLLNVSAVPKRVVETNENLGIPQVHVGCENQDSLLITFMWTMGWYQFRVELVDAGRITLADRGYEERVDLRPNASSRTDGTVQLAPSQIKAPTPKDTSDPKPTGVTSGVIISKSMMGQRTDDENVPADWKSKRAPDFDWGR
jgi:hypothetical protein